MKNSFFSGLLFLCLFFAGCGSKKQVSEKETVAETIADTIPKEEEQTQTTEISETSIEIPEVLQDKQVVVEYFETYEKIIDEYATAFEELAKTSQAMEEKKAKGEKTEAADALLALTQMASLTTKIAPLMEKMQELEKKAQLFKKDMTPEEVKAFSKTYVKVMARLQKVQNKK